MAYSKEERERIIQYHLTSGNSLSRTSKEFGIGGSMTLAKWLKNFEESKKSSTFAAETNPIDAMQEKSNADLQRLLYGYSLSDDLRSITRLPKPHTTQSQTKRFLEACL